MATTGVSSLFVPVEAEAREGLGQPPFTKPFVAPKKRRNESYRLRQSAAIDEKQQELPRHETNGDEEAFANKIGNYSKNLPHNELGEVDVEAYDALVKATQSGRFEDAEAIPLGGNFGLLNPLGGLTYNISGPDTAATGVGVPPSVTSSRLAYEAAELYWMAALRDVPFAHWDTSPLVAEAINDLSQFRERNQNRELLPRTLTPDTLFRPSYPGVLEGPKVSQFLYQPFNYDAISVDPRISNPLPGSDVLTDYDEWLSNQRGNQSLGQTPSFSDARYPYKGRDLGQIAGNDSIYSVYYRAALVLNGLLGFGRGFDAGNPYNGTRKQIGFASFGLAHLLQLVARAPQAERGTWYQKWQVHRMLRPQKFGGLVHNVLTGAADYPIDPLGELTSSPVMDHVFQSNKRRNQERGLSADGTYLLPHRSSFGAPPHPSYPAGHAISAGACVTVLKAWFDEDLELPRNALKQPNADGTRLDTYRVGADGPPLTIGGELNKLAVNLSWGRNWAGVHWSSDNLAGNLQGQEIAIRILRELRETYPEPFGGLSLTKFDGTKVTV